MSRLLVLVVALLAASPAYALDAWMWGVGPRIGTNIIPGHYPSRFPQAVRDVDTLQKFRGDVILGADAVYYVDKHTRALASVGMGLARGDTNYTDYHLLLKYNYVIQTGAMDFLFGGGLGVGTCRFKDDDTRELLKMPYYPFRVEGSAMIRDRSRAYQLTVFLQYAVPSSFSYYDSTGVEVPDVRGGIYATMGAEVVLYFGDFVPPKKKNAS